MMSPTADNWLAKLAHLNVYRAKHGAAPHKPLLLLVILELAETGCFVDRIPAAGKQATVRRAVKSLEHFVHFLSKGFYQPVESTGQPVWN